VDGAAASTLPLNGLKHKPAGKSPRFVPDDGFEDLLS
jgi:hypothetical protein